MGVGSSSAFLNLIGSGFKDITISKSVQKIGLRAIGYYWSNSGRGDNYILYGTIDGMIIRGYKGTAAEEYAIENGITFIALDEPEVTTTTAVTTNVTTETTVVTTTTQSSTTPTTTQTIATSATPTNTSLTVSETTVSDTSVTSSTSVTASSTIVTTTPSVTTNVKSDANSDNKLDVRDAAFIARKLAQQKPQDIPKWADYNDDNVVNVRDAAAIARYFARLVVKS